MIKNNILENKCDICNQIPFHNGKKLVLALDHINGINNDNRLENLRLLCPNCHSQTSTFGGGRNKKKYNCKKCGKQITKYSKLELCKNCKDFNSRKVKNRPSCDELQQMINNISWCAIGRRYGVSDNAVRKWAKSYNITMA